MMASPTDPRSGSDTCPSPEEVAAFLDGKLPPRERERVAAHLADCQRCYEVFAGAARFLEDHPAGEESPRGGLFRFPFSRGRTGPMTRFLALAASLLLMAFLGYFVWRGFFSTPTLNLASVAGPLEGAPGVAANLYESPVYRGPGDEGDGNWDPELFLAGVRLLDLRLSAQAGDVDRARRALEDLADAVEEIPFLEKMASELREEAARVTDAESLRGTLPAIEREVEAELGETLFFDFGLWAEAGRLSAASRNPELFEHRANRRFLKRLLAEVPGRLDTPDAVMEDLRHIQRLGAARHLDSADFQALQARFAEIIRWYDESSDSLY
jgi:hypothetical protein